MKKWIWWIVGGVAIYAAYTMFFKKNGSTASDDAAARMRSNARVR